MKPRIVKVPAAALSKFIDQLRALPESPVGRHLAEAEYVRYSTGLLGTGEVQEVDKHLASCPECAAAMENLLGEPKVWQSGQTQERLASIKRRLMEQFPSETEPGVIARASTRISTAVSQFTERLLEAIDGLLPRAAPAFGVGADPVEIKTDDASFGARLAVLENGDLSISVGSREAGLANQSVCIAAGEKRWTATFRKVTIRQQDQVVAELVLKHAELLALPQGSVLRARLGTGD